ncbi:unnamed protein product, partial [Ectocarpus sp. 12 AP-2014]
PTSCARNLNLRSRDKRGRWWQRHKEGEEVVEEREDCRAHHPLRPSKAKRVHALVTLLLLLPFRSRRRRRRGRRHRRRCTFKEQDPGRSLALPVDGVQLHLEDEI